MKGVLRQYRRNDRPLFRPQESVNSVGCLHANLPQHAAGRAPGQSRYRHRSSRPWSVWTATRSSDELSMHVLPSRAHRAAPKLANQVLGALKRPRARTIAGHRLSRERKVRRRYPPPLPIYSQPARRLLLESEDRPPQSDFPRTYREWASGRVARRFGWRGAAIEMDTVNRLGEMIVAAD